MNHQVYLKMIRTVIKHLPLAILGVIFLNISEGQKDHTLIHYYLKNETLETN